MKGYLYLSTSIIVEIIATASLKLSNGFTVLIPSIIVVLGYLLAFYCLSKSLVYFPLSIAYAIWSGVGTAITALLGVLLFSDPFNSSIVLGICCIIIGVILMNISSAAPE